MTADKQQQSKKLSKAQVQELFDILAQENPQPTTELAYTSPFTLLVAVVLSAQATDKGVNKATEKLFPVADTPQAMVELGEDALRGYIASIGLYKNKAKHVMALSEKLINEFNGQVPQNQKDLESLPGVGRKTANVIRNTLWDAPAIAVDTHVFRVANRTGLAPGKTPLEVEKNLLKRVPKPYLKNAHHWLILHGRYICLARQPQCKICPVAHICPAAINPANNPPAHKPKESTR